MAYPKKRSSKPRKSPIPLILIGSGLIVVAIAVIIFAPKDNGPLKMDPDVSRIPGEVDFPAPELALENLGGDPVTLSEFRGQVVLVNNWATWCPPCRAEMPELEAYFRAHVDEERCPGGVCKALINYWIDQEKCIGCGKCAKE